MSDSGAPQDPTQPAPDRRPTWAPRADAAWPATSDVRPPTQPVAQVGPQSSPQSSPQPSPQPSPQSSSHSAPDPFPATQGFPTDPGAQQLPVDPATPPAPVDPAAQVDPTAPAGPASPTPGDATHAVPAHARPPHAAARTGAHAAVPAPDGPDGSGSSRRPAWLLPVAIGAGVLVVVGVVAGLVLANRGDDSASPVAPSTIRLPSPTPSVEPVARTADTPFAQVLPASVLQYALASSTADDEWTQAGALEAYTEEFSDGAGGTFTVQVGQWPTNAAAKEFAEALAAELPTDSAAGGTSAGTALDEPGDGATVPAKPAPTDAPASDDALPQSDVVRVGDAIAGRFTAAEDSPGTGVVVWYNRTAVFRAEGPVADVLNFYRAFPV
mgnify:CR=1 FL=1